VFYADKEYYVFNKCMAMDLKNWTLISENDYHYLKISKKLQKMNNDEWSTQKNYFAIYNKGFYKMRISWIGAKVIPSFRDLDTVKVSLPNIYHDKDSYFFSDLIVQLARRDTRKTLVVKNCWKVRMLPPEVKEKQHGVWLSRPMNIIVWMTSHTFSQFELSVLDLVNDLPDINSWLGSLLRDQGVRSTYPVVNWKFQTNYMNIPYSEQLNMNNMRKMMKVLQLKNLKELSFMRDFWICNIDAGNIEELQLVLKKMANRNDLTSMKLTVINHISMNL